MTEVLVTGEFETWWQGLTAGEQEDVAFVVGLLETKGVALDPWRSAVLLIGGSKAGRGDRFYADAVPKAERLYEEYVKRRGLEEEAE